MQVTYHFGHRNLCNDYVIKYRGSNINMLIINNILCNAYVTE